MRTGISWLDVKIGLRMLVKHPALTLVGGFGMAVAIAISVGFFAFVQVHIYPTLPLEEGERIVALENRDQETNNEERRSLHDFVLWREELQSVRDLGAFRTVERNLLLGDGPPQPVQLAEMSAAGFRVARVAPLMGRVLTDDDERATAAPVLVIGYDVWQNRFAGDPGIIGRQVRLGTAMHTIVGVMPKDFGFPQSHQYWIPFRADPLAFERRQGPSIFIFGRLAPGATMQEAQAELTLIGRRTAAAFPKTNAKLQPMVMPYIHSLTDIQGSTLWEAALLQMMMSLLLIVVALNVAVLVYARTAMRHGEIAVRTALGASRRRIVAQLFVEALVFALCAAAVGLGIAGVGVRLGNGIMAAEMEGATPFWIDSSLQPSTILFTVGVTLLTAAIVGVFPALQATGRNLQDNLRQLGVSGGAKLGKAWNALIVGQIAIAVAALPAAATIGIGVIRGAATHPTYRPEEFLMARLRPEVPTGQRTPAELRADSARFGLHLVEVERRLEAEPRVAGASYSAYVPGRRGRIEIEGLPMPAASPSGHWVDAQGVAPDYFALYGARQLAGRGFESGDLREGATAVIVDDAFVAQILGGGSALGRRLRHTRPAADSAPGPWYEIVGVVSALTRNELDSTAVRPHLYYAVGPAQAQAVSLELRVRGATPADFAPRLREIAFAVDPELRLGQVHSLAEFERQNELAGRLVGLGVGLVLVSVFLLSAAGVYALTSFTVTRRRREIGIRTALGAHPMQVLRGIFARVARQVAIGLAVGIVAAAVVDRLAGGEMMRGMAGVLLPTFGVALALVALLAALGPARRALRVQPSEALRSDG